MARFTPFALGVVLLVSGMAWGSPTPAVGHASFPVSLLSVGSLLIATKDIRAAGNTAFATTVIVPNGPFPPGSTTILAEEPLSGTTVIGIGVVIISSGSAPIAYTTWRVWQSGTLVDNVTNSSGPLAAGSVVLLQASGGSAHGWWNFTANGNLIRNGSATGTDTTAGSLSAAAFVSGALPVSAPSLSVSTTGNEPGIDIATVWSMGFYHSTVTLSPGSAYVVSASQLAGIGQDQNLSTSPDSLVVGTNVSGEATGTYLWGYGGPSFQAEVPWDSTSPSVLGNAGTGFNLTVPANATLPGDFCLSVDEPIPGGVNFTVALCSLGPSESILLFVVVTYANGTGYQGEPNAPGLAGLDAITIELQSLGGGLWEALLNGVPLAIPTSGTNFNLGSSRSSSVLSPSVSWDLGDGGPFGGGVNLSQALLVDIAGTWEVAPDGATQTPATGAAVCASGNAQNWLIAPGAVDLGVCTAVLPAGTDLWNATATAPVLSLTLRGAPSSLSSLEIVTVSMYVNASSGTGSTPQSPVAFALTPSYLFGPVKVVGTGAYAVTMNAPAQNATLALDVNVAAGAPGTYPVTTGFPLDLVPGNITVGDAPSAGSTILDTVNSTLEFWVNASTTPSQPVDNALISASATDGGVFGTVLPLGGGEYSTVYSPPLVSRSANDTILLQVTAPGFYLLQSQLNLVLSPGPMVATVEGLPGRVPAGGSVDVALWANATNGRPLPVAWTATLSLPSLQNVSILSSQAPGPAGGTLAVLTFPALPQSNATTITLTAHTFGYADGKVIRNVNITVADYALAVVPSGKAYGGATVALLVEATLTNGSPVANVTVTLSLPVGSGSLTPSNVVTNGSGSAQFDWTPPTSGGTWTALVDSQGPPGFASFYENITLTAIPAKTGTTSPAAKLTPLIIFAAGLVGAVALVLLWGYIRYRRRLAAEKPKATSRKRSRGKTETPPASPPPA